MKRGEDLDDERPKTGWSARTLGARCNIDIRIDEDGYVRLELGGISVSPPPPENLPRIRLPRELGGTGKDPIWQIETDELPDELLYRPDPDPNKEGHGFIEPTRVMTFEEYQRALHQTRDLWTLFFE